MKLLLEVATKSELNRKAEKDGNILFFCKKHGKECFSIRMARVSEEKSKESKMIENKVKLE